MIHDSLLTDRLGHSELIGGPGYTFPILSNVNEFSFEALATTILPNVRIVGDFGPNNRLIFAGGVPPSKPLTLLVNGSTTDALVIIGDQVTFTGHISLFSRNQTVILSGGAPEVGHSGQINVQMWGEGQVFFIGHGTSSNGATFVISYREHEIIIGDDCMFADGIHMATSDQHAVVDVSTGNLVNSSGNILLEPHVWVCRLSSINKGVTVGLGSIVGSHTLVNRSVPRFCAVGGVPARILREGTTWDRTPAPRPATLAYVQNLANQLRAKPEKS